MKKFLLAATAVLCCVTAQAQFTLDLDLVGRVEGRVSNDKIYDGNAGFDFGTSSAYTKIEGAYSDWFSFTIINHWLENGYASALFESTPYLYENTWTTSGNWCDMLYVDFTPGNWLFRLGKYFLMTDGYEYEYWDWDVPFEMFSNYFYNMSSYQWGGNVGWTTPSEKTSFTLQAYSSPMNEKPFSDGLMSYVVQHTGSYGPIEMINSVSYIQHCKEHAMASFAIGIKGYLNDNFSITAQYMNRQDTGDAPKNVRDFFSRGSSTFCALNYESSNGKYEAMLRGGYDCFNTEAESIMMTGESFESWYVGGTFSYFPLKGSKDLKLQARLANNTSPFFGGISATIGVTYNHTFHIFK